MYLCKCKYVMKISVLKTVCTDGVFIECTHSDLNY